MRGCIFDLDGTLIDSLGDIAGALNHVLAERGMPVHAPDAYRAMIGEGAAELVRRALPPGRDGELEEVLAAYRARYRAHPIVETTVYDGIAEVLVSLEARGIPKAVVTNKPHAGAIQIVEALLGRYRWSAIIGERADVPRKPAPDMALAAADALGCAPGACWFGGDSAIDMKTAHDAGMVAIGCAWGFRGRDELEANGAVHVAESPCDLLRLLST